MNKQNKFEEKYFEGYYKKAVGDFMEHDLIVAKRWFWAWIKKLENYVPLEKGKSVLEIGCSIGGVASILLDKGLDVHATDVSKYAVNRAKKTSKNIKFSVLDAREKIKLNKKFDYVLAFEVVEHLEDPQKAIKNMVGVLKKEGYLVFSTPYPYTWSFRDPTHINVKYPREWIEIMKNAGLKNIVCHSFSLIPFFYKLNKEFQIIIPFHIPIPYINNPIFFIGRK